MRLALTFAVLSGIFVETNRLDAQMVSTQVPFQTHGSSFYEASHIGWGIHNPHYFISVNGGGASPPFGGYQPNAGLHGGLMVNGQPFDFAFGQGSSITSTTTTPSLTTSSGFPGSLFIGREVPFVTGVVPINGNGNINGNGLGFGGMAPLSPLQAKIATGQIRAEEGKIVVPRQAVAAREMPAPQRPDRQPPSLRPESASPSAADYMQRGRLAQKEGRAGVAKIYFQLAATKGDARIKEDAQLKLEELKANSRSLPERRGGPPTNDTASSNN